ncbi:RagB/SusD family nutrient uptake outer membrane protein [Flavobacterium gawalongense]|uniref:RagB/SusD family nutrient uptake outer membrane protein n=1 Tax=Flavobacterium gawalongense TaxID=2594432 RepID=A0A553BF58_9FLAO|nr:RagB/SusD family nutrient uptake outer membrane protein [Flavobacterium gawalongense]TRW99754.1 RagB/SusD family nutrient uptake outer membrane protein [Flavobacterium gawalongense]TRX03859.1 RagB/SusD family nutrient uptake outer membrane protein [Flavobacterium gawalongense]TRX06886.1 RagB/SusD family nutrient uptake outer membrane protein [Flavobacterium gawalongense]TRX07619.1 RagB/SusD family nutrient uptake outer membrane protein [Flavobacterium gawalongense]TRX23495.1 RagB/SusD famil
MKTMKFKYLFIAVALVSLGSCSEEFVNVTPKGSFLSDNYYANEEQATAALVGVYDPIRKNSGGFENIISMMNAGSDDFYAGGGGSTDGAGIQAFSTHTLTSTNVAGSFWNDHYQGIFRANTLLLKLPDVAMPDNLKARFAAESKALRAIYYFNLVRMFKNVPLLLDPLTATNMYDVEQAAPEAVYAQIEKDLLEAINVLPTTVPAATESGRLTRGAAQAMLGKVYLYEGKKTEAAAVLAQVNGTPGATNQYGNKLLSNFNDLWVVANKFNTESIIEVSHTSAGNSDWWFWGSGRDEGNSLNVMVGPRSYSRPSGSTAPDLPSGWSFNVITQDLYDAIKLDPRFGATVFDLKALKAAGQADYIGGYQDTGYFLNKFLPRKTDVRTGGGAAELNYKQNTYVIRLADTYLMEAEALGSGARAQALLDAVRARVGLPSVPVTLAAIKNERRMELAGEGHRFFDLVRWGDAATKLANRGFVAGKDEVFPIPTRELQGTKLKQNPGYN